MPLPLFLLSPQLPWGAALVVVAAFAFFTPLVNAPVIGMLTVRTPAELRPKVMTAVMTVATMAGPFGFITAGYVLRHVDLGPFFLGLPALLTLAAWGWRRSCYGRRVERRATSRCRTSRTASRNFSPTVPGRSSARSTAPAPLSA